MAAMGTMQLPLERNELRQLAVTEPLFIISPYLDSGGMISFRPFCDTP